MPSCRVWQTATDGPPDVSSSRSPLGPVFLQKRQPSWGHANDRLAIRVFDRHESAISGVLPYGQPRTRRPPRVHGFVIGTVSAGQPFQEIKNENFDGLRHTYPAILSGSAFGHGDRPLR